MFGVWIPLLLVAGCGHEICCGPPHTKFLEGKYTVTYTNYGGSCGTNNISGTLQLDPLTLTATDSGFDFRYDDEGFNRHYVYHCPWHHGETVTVCSADAMSVARTENGDRISDVTISPTMAVWTSSAVLVETDTGQSRSVNVLDGGVNGELVCEGDNAECASYAELWELSMPCTMSYDFHAVLETVE